MRLSREKSSPVTALWCPDSEDIAVGCSFFPEMICPLFTRRACAAEALTAEIDTSRMKIVPSEDPAKK